MPTLGAQMDVEISSQALLVTCDPDSAALGESIRKALPALQVAVWVPSDESEASATSERARGVDLFLFDARSETPALYERIARARAEHPAAALIALIDPQAAYCEQLLRAGIDECCALAYGQRATLDQPPLSAC